MNVILTLLWKEYRSNAYLVVVGCAVLFLPVLISFSMVYGNRRSPDVPFSDVLPISLIFGAIIGLVLSQFMLLCLGGHLIGGERSTRTFEFLFNQPVSRFRIVSSKLMFAFVWAVTVWALGGLILLIGFQLMEPGSGPNLEGMGSEFFFEVAAGGAMLFGASWLASNWMDNSVLAMALGAFLATAVFLVLRVIAGQFDSLIEIGGYDWTRIIVMTVLSIVTTTIGARIFVKRKSP